jgi:uncharacterized protein
MNRKEMFRVLAGAVAAMPLLMTGARGATPSAKHRIAMQVDVNDAATMNLALNNTKNIVDYYAQRNETAAIEIVTYGPGLHMLRADTSPVKDRIAQIASADATFPSKIVFSACNNTKKAMEKHEGHPISIIPQARIVPSGVVRIMQLEEQGWDYVRP